MLFVYLAIGMALDAKMTVGMIFAYQAYKRQFLDAGIRLTEQAINYNILQVHLARISDIALSKPEDLAVTHYTQVEQSGARHFPSIELRNVRFSYGVGEPEILTGVNFKIESGESVAFVGPSGGGKTTLLKILMGLLRPTYGEVLIDGQPIDSYGIARWRAQVGSVAQDDQLFAGSIAENITFFDPDPDMVRIESAATAACIEKEIDNLPMRYETLVGDMGSVFSGGQKQRILLARALYQQPAILMLDEGTSHLDAECQRLVMESLDRNSIPAIVVSHREESILPNSKIVTVCRSL